MVAATSTVAYGAALVALAGTLPDGEAVQRVAGRFRPPPKVESALVRMVAAGKPDRSTMTCCGALSPRGASSCATRCPAWTSARAGIDPALRAENLSPSDYARLSMNSIL
jgi:16S rRNA A1518/A1519 N6-dimethyltransferase RsmA/KsgA/DIM1 with predicted DNA glycosylase/AP lyase activity